MYDTLDIRTRLGRYIIQELTGWQGWFGRIFAAVVTSQVKIIWFYSTIRGRREKCNKERRYSGWDVKSGTFDESPDGICGAGCGAPMPSDTSGGIQSFPATNPPPPVINAPGVPENVIVDGSFENGSPNPDWNESSTNFGTPLCTVSGCGTGTGTGPRTGAWWAWFGGIDAYEEGVMSQTVTISSRATAVLNFQLEIPVCGGPSDFLEVRVDDHQEWIVYASSPLCGVLGYAPVSVDLWEYADGGQHLIEFHSISGTNGNLSNFFVDDVELIVTPSGAIPTVNEWGIMILSVIVVIAGILAMRKYRPAGQA